MIKEDSVPLAQLATVVARAAGGGSQQLLEGC